MLRFLRRTLDRHAHQATGVDNFRQRVQRLCQGAWMLEPPWVAHDQLGVFTTAQALARGWTISRLRTAVHHGRLRKLRSGVYAVPAIAVRRRVDPAKEPHPSELRRIVAAQASIAASLGVKGVVASHQAAATFHGLATMGPSLGCITAARSIGQLDSVHRHWGHLGPSDTVEAGLAVVTSLPRTVCDVAREQGHRAGLMAADAALSRGLSVEELELQLAAQRGWPGSRAAQRVVALADGRAESPLESLSRLALVEHGFADFDLQQDLYDEDGVWIARVDFYWDEFRLAGEADGKGKYRSQQDLQNEQLREERLERAGYRWVRWNSRDVWDFGETAARLRQAMRFCS
jgi:very-short-patch-repair endonuclease